MDDIAFLAQGIKEDGFFGAIEVYKKPDGRYEISAGHRRYEAMKLLGRKTIPCIVKEIPDDFARGKKLLSSNIRNRKLTPMDWARSVAYYEHLLVENGQKKNFEKQATEFFNISSSQLYRYQCLLKLIPELQELADNPLFPFSALREAVSLTPEGQMQLYKQLSVHLEKGTSNEDNTEIKLTRTKIVQIINNIRDQEEYQARPNIESNRQERQEEKRQQSIREALAEPDNEPEQEQVPILDNSIKEEVEDIREMYQIESIETEDSDTEDIEDVIIYRDEEVHDLPVLQEQHISKDSREKDISRIYPSLNELQEILNNGFTVKNQSDLEICIEKLEDILNQLKKRQHT
jgi:ParB family chromosome partitioning protein